MPRRYLSFALAAMAVACPAWAPAADQDTAQQIAQYLRASGQLSDYSIGVKYEDGKAWLIGRVANEEQMARAVQLAEGHPGVTQVVPKLEIKATRTAAANKAPAPLMAAGGDAPTVRFADPSAPAAGPVQLTAHEAGNGSMTDPGDPLAQAPVAKVTAAMSRRFSGEPAFRPEAGGRGRQVNYEKAPSTAGVKPTYAKSEPATFSPGGQSRHMVASNTQGGTPATNVGLHHQRAAMRAAGGGYTPAMGGNVSVPAYDQPNMPNYAWPGYAAHPNYAAVTYPKQYSPTAWPFIGPFYPYPQVPLGWRKVTLEWDDGWWFLEFDDRRSNHLRHGWRH